MTINRGFVVTNHIDQNEIFEAGKLYKVIEIEADGYITAQHDVFGPFFCSPVGRRCAQLGYVGTWHHPTK